MRRQERKHAARLQKMLRYRLRIQQLTLTNRSTLHTEIIAKNHHQHADRHADYSGQSRVLVVDTPVKIRGG